MRREVTKTVSPSTEKCELSKDFSQRFKMFRENSGMTQEQLAALLIKSPGYISQIERGIVEPGGLLLEKFETIERSPVYSKKERTLSVGESQLLRSAPSNMPPHQEPPGLRLREDSAPYGTVEPIDLGRCVKWLSEIEELHAEKFQSVAVMIKSVWESVKK